jgi:fermentation-respiration switch protein FrsA (DUF1100 family)
VKIVIAAQDEIIPPRFGQRLYDSYKGPKELEVIPDAGHNDIAEQSPQWWQKVFQFWAQHSANETKASRGPGTRVLPR